MNKNIFFKIEDNFDSIIRKKLENERVTNIKQNPTGWTNIVFEVKTEENIYFFRFPRDEFWSRTIVKDYEFAKYIYGKTDFDTVNLVLKYDNGRPFSIHKKIPGTPLAEKMKDLTDDEIRDVSKDIAKFMYQLHSKVYNKNEIFTINNIGLDLVEFLSELLNVHVSEKDRSFWDKIPIYSEKEKCLVHGDLNSSNILLDENNHMVAVIDFGFGGFGNKYDDIARIIGRCPIKFKDEIVKSYESYSKLKLDSKELENNIDIWSNIDQGYINYMRTIGIYK